MKYTDFDKLVEDFSSASYELNEKKRKGVLTESDREAYQAAKVALKRAYDEIYKAAFSEGKKMILDQF